MALRTALMQLNDFHNLRRSALLPRLLGPNDASPLQLQQVLFDAIDAVRQAGSAPAQRAHEILYLRYVEQAGQGEVAAQLGVSVRQLRREQGNAIERLADVLIKRFQLVFRPETPPSVHAVADTPVAPPTSTDELSWLRTQFSNETSVLPPQLGEAVQNVAGLAQRHQITLGHTLADGLPTLAMPALVVRQLLTTLLTVAVTHTQPGVLRITAKPTGSGVALSLQAARTDNEQSSPTAEFQQSFQLLAPLLAEFGGQIQTQVDVNLCVLVTLPSVHSVPVLVVDDNPDTQQLFARYAQNARFRVIASGDGEQALALAQTAAPAALVLDVMMPGLDGWDLLARLRHHPRTAAIPVIVCSILPQAELARFVGAATFLQKPVSQQAFLGALAHATTAAVIAPG